MLDEFCIEPITCDEISQLVHSKWYSEVCVIFLMWWSCWNCVVKSLGIQTVISERCEPSLCAIAVRSVNCSNYSLPGSVSIRFWFPHHFCLSNKKRNRLPQVPIFPSVPFVESNSKRQLIVVTKPVFAILCPMGIFAATPLANRSSGHVDFRTEYNNVCHFHWEVEVQVESLLVRRKGTLVG